MKKMLVSFTLPVCLLLACCSSGNAEKKQDIAATEKQASARDADPGVVVMSTRPSDIPVGAANATLTQAAQFAWNQFIALNWPAVPQDGTNREKPSVLPFGTTGQPLIWQTYRSRVELFPWQDSLPPGATQDPGTGKVTFHYNATPQYYYKKKIQSCNQSPDPGVPPWVNLDEISQIGLNFMFDGDASDDYPPTGNSVPKLIRFLAKGNSMYSEYINEHSYFNHGGTYFQDVTNFKNAVANDKPPADGSGFIEFPSDTVMVKSAWRLLTKAELASGRFYSAPVRFYEKKAGKICYNDEAGWGMVALHIVQRSPSTPHYFTFATFEQADNITNVFGNPIESTVGGATPNGSPTTPEISHTDYPNPVTTTAKGAFCNPSGNGHLFYKNSAPGLPQATDGHGGICVNNRRYPIPQQIVDVNKEAQQKIQVYDQANNVTNSPWPYYKLINVQFQPFSAADINDSNPNRLTSTYRQANIVVETNYTLQNFSGRLTNDDLSSDGQTTDFTATGTPFTNVLIANSAKMQFAHYNMGGCMGCHGNAQVGGTDFSFMLFEGPEIEPETPDFSQAALAARRKEYKF